MAIILLISFGIAQENIFKIYFIINNMENHHNGDIQQPSDQSWISQ